MNVVSYALEKNKSHKLIKELLERGGIKENSSLTPLLDATYRGDCEKVKRLLENGANADETREGDTIGTTPLMVASDLGYAEIVRELLKNGARVDKFEETENSEDVALNKAIKNERIEVIKELVKNGANINIENKKGETPLSIALERDKLYCVKQLIDSGVDTSGIIEPLELAIWHGNFGEVRSLLIRETKTLEYRRREVSGKNSNENKILSLLKIAAFLGNEDIAMELFKYTDKTPYIYSDISKAIEGGNLKIAEIMLDKKVVYEDIDDVLKMLDNLFYEAIGLRRVFMIEEENIKYPIEIVRKRVDIAQKIKEKIEQLKIVHVAESLEEIIRKNYHYDEGIFIFLAEQGDTVKVEEMLESNERLRDKIEDAFQAAVSKGHASLVEKLIKKGAPVNPKEIYRKNPLLEATKKGDIDVMEILIKNGADVNRNIEGIGTPLMLAAYFNQIEAVGVLLKYGAKPDIVNKNGETALMIAMRLDNLKLSEEIKKITFQAIPTIQAIPTTTALPKEPMYIKPTTTIKNKVVKTLSKKSDSSLINASEDNNLIKVKLILKTWLLKNKIYESGQDINKIDKEGRTALMVASYNGNIEIVRELLIHGASVNKANKKGETPLMKASENGKLEIVKELLKKRGRIDYVDETGETAVMKAVENGHTALAKELIWKGIEIDKTDKSGRTLLMIASEKGDVEIVKLLLELGAEVEKTDVNNETALMKAEVKGYTDVVEELNNKK